MRLLFRQLGFLHLCLAALLLSMQLASAQSFKPVIAGQPVERADVAPQKTWHWTAVPASAQHLPWPEAFAFKEIFGTPTDTEVQYTRWLNLKPRDAQWMPAFYDTVDARWVSLAPSARVMCNGTYVDTVLEPAHARATGLMFRFSFMYKLRPDVPTRHIETAGEIDAQGQWMAQPVQCPHGSQSVASTALVLSVPPTQPEIELITHLGHPALRNIQTRQWITPPPPDDPVLAVWWRVRREFSLTETYKSGSGEGVIDMRGTVLLPYFFDKLPNVRANGTLPLCIYPDHPESSKRCVPYRLAKADQLSKKLRPKQAADGLWGYTNAQGQWAIPAQFLKARPFVNGYAVVHGKIPPGWRPTGPRSNEPVIGSIVRIGHAWVVSAAAPDGIESASYVGYRAVINDQGRWLLPFID
jgi:WG containing repeat